LVSDPVSGADEFVEIFNPYNNVIPLSGWKIQDASGKNTPLPDQLLGREQFLIVKNPAGRLNNDADAVRLLDPTGQIIDQVAYGTKELPAAKKPKALGRAVDGAWCLAEPTPGEANLCPVLLPIEPPLDPVVSPIVPATVSSDPPPALAPPEQNYEDLQLNEVYPSPAGSDAADEFIEIINRGPAYVNVQNVILEDASGRRFVARDFWRLAPGAVVAFRRPQTKLTLNNSSDAVRLLAPDGSLLDEIEYAQAPKGGSFASDGEDWSWTAAPSPDEPNRFPENDRSAAVTAAAAPRRVSAAKAVAGFPHLTVAAAKELSDDARAKVSGTVTVAPGVLGQQKMYLHDASGDLQIYKNDARFPALAAGDQVTVSGLMGTSAGERRLKIRSGGTLVIMGHGQPPAPEPFAIADLSDEDTGRLVASSGVVLRRASSQAVLEDGGEELVVQIAAAADVDPAVFAKGAVVAVTGIAVIGPTAKKIYPRGHADIQLISPPPTVAAAVGRAAAASAKQTSGLIVLTAAAGLFLILALRRLIPKVIAYARHPDLRLFAKKTRGA
jgi:hypothetical protein